MTEKVQLSRKDARKLLLDSQGLNRSLEPDEALEHLSYVQIDTISVVERAHHHVLWSRDSKYRPQQLDKLISSRQAFEYWAHAASYLPMKDYRYSLVAKKRFKNRTTPYWPRDTQLMKEVLKRIRTEGPLKASDFKAPKRKGSGWWDWKPAKLALERLFFEGELEVTRRQGFQKVYDLPERVIPSKVDTHLPSESEYAEYLISRTLNHHGLATLTEIAYLRKAPVKKAVEKQIKKMLEGGQLVEASVESLKSRYYLRPSLLEKKTAVSRRVHILSPFDNLVIQRKKLKDFFDFDYQIECYLPESKRKYGYFTLPVLIGQELVGRLDCKAFRDERVLKVKKMHWEDRSLRQQHAERLKKKIADFAKFNGCDEWTGRI